MPEEAEPIAKPTYVKVAGWLMIAPATVGVILPIPALRVSAVLAAVCALVGLVLIYGLFAVNLNLPGAWLAGGWGSLAAAVLGLVMVVATNGLGFCVTLFAAPVAVLLLAPAESRAWFR